MMMISSIQQQHHLLKLPTQIGISKVDKSDNATLLN
jgi:hypothetical protein